MNYLLSQKVGQVTFISCLDEGRSLDPAVVGAEERVVVVCRAGEEGDDAPSTIKLSFYRVAEVGGGGCWNFQA